MKLLKRGLAALAIVFFLAAGNARAQIALGRIVVANAGTTGTTLNKLTKITGAPSKAVITATTDTGGAIGITVSGAGTTSNATIQQFGGVSCVFDGATTAGDYVQISSSTAGDCHDSGSTYPTSGQVVGRILSTNGSGGTYSMILFVSEIEAAVGGGPGTGTQHAVTFWSSSSVLGSVTPPSANGQYNCGYTVTGAAAVDPTCPQIGMGGRAVTGSTTSVTIAYGDNGTIIDHDQAATGTAAVTLPTATTLGNAAFVFIYTNHSAQTDTITPTTWTIQGGTSAAASSLSVPPGYSVRIKVDPNSSTNWIADSAH